MILDEKSAGIGVPAVVWQGIDAVRLSGLTNMLDRPAVVRIAEEREYLAWVFTRLLVMSECRGPHATGVAWLTTPSGTTGLIWRGSGRAWNSAGAR